MMIATQALGLITIVTIVTIVMINDHHNGVTEEMVEKAADGGALEKWKMSNSNAGLWMPYNTLGVLGTGFLCLIGTGFKLKKRR